MRPTSAHPKDGPLRRQDGFANSRCAAARSGDASNGPRGQQSSIVAREYRYVSPVFQFDPKDGVVTRLLRAGLTNNPNLHLTAIAASRTAAANNETKDEQMEFPTQELRELLNLDSDATVADVRRKSARAARGRRCGVVTID